MDSTELPSSSTRVFDGSEEPAGTREKFDLFAVGCRDERPIVDSGSGASTCPVDYGTSVPTEKVHYSMNLESVLGESLQHYCIKRNVPFSNRTGSTMNVNFVVTDTKRAILSVHEGCGHGSMIVFTPDGKGKIVNDTNCIDQVKQIMARTPGFDSGISFPVIRKEYWERALKQAQHDHDRKESVQQDVHGENQNTIEHVKVKVPPKLYEPTKEERQSHEATHCASCEICVKATSPDGKHAKQVGNPEHVPVIEFDYAFATDTLGGPKIVMMFVVDSVHGSIFAVVRRKRWPG